MARLIELKRRWNLYGNFGSTKFTSLLSKQLRVDHCFESVARQTKVGKIHTARSHRDSAQDIIIQANKPRNSEELCNGITLNRFLHNNSKLLYSFVFSLARAGVLKLMMLATQLRRAAADVVLFGGKRLNKGMH
jgi:hypothetical protein